jgi:putative flippase GtrA
MKQGPCHSPPPLPPSAPRGGIAGEFLRFGVVGSAGFVVDTATVYALGPRLGLVPAGLLAYFFAASANFLANRLWTFRHRPPRGWLKPWLAFLTANGAGFAVNRGLYVLLVTTLPLARTAPILAIAAGTLGGMFFNFTASRRFVFRPGPDTRK